MREVMGRNEKRRQAMRSHKVASELVTVIKMLAVTEWSRGNVLTDDLASSDKSD